MKKYTDSHEWISIENNIATVGISRFAADEIGDIVFVELPEVGKVLKKDDVAAVVESSKAAIDIASPAAGTVVTVNELLHTAPELVSQHPESTGWIYRILLTDLTAD